MVRKLRRGIDSTRAAHPPGLSTVANPRLRPMKEEGQLKEGKRQRKGSCRKSRRRLRHSVLYGRFMIEINAAWPANGCHALARTHADEAAMNAVHEQIEGHIPSLLRFARALTHNPISAEDLVQECLMRALLKQHLFRDGTNLGAWLVTIMHNLYVNMMRRRWNSEVLYDPQRTPEAAMGPAQEEHMMLRAAEHAMRAVPDSQRVALELVKVLGLSYKEAAKLLDLPVGTVKSRVARAQQTVRTSLDGDAPVGRRAAGRERSRAKRRPVLPMRRALVR